MFTILGLISAVAKVLSALIGWARDRQLITLGAAQNALKAVEQANVEVEIGRKARLDQRATNTNDPANGMSDDKFKRPDDAG